MAKIIDFKTKEVLADLPSNVTPKTNKLWRNSALESVYVIATFEDYADEIFEKIAAYDAYKEETKVG